MLQFGMTLKAAKANFFDPKAVMDRVGKTKKGVLARFGAMVRTTAQRSLRNRKAPSKPGKPPSSHTKLLKRHIYFSYDAMRDSVVVGPIMLNGRAYRNIAETLEYGGTDTRQFFVIEDTPQVRGRRRRPTSKARIVHSRKAPKRTVRYLPRPYMTPAFEAEKPNLPKLWANAVK